MAGIGQSRAVNEALLRIGMKAVGQACTGSRLSTSSRKGRARRSTIAAFGRHSLLMALAARELGRLDSVSPHQKICSACGLDGEYRFAGIGDRLSGRVLGAARVRLV